jgi:hypothetical protein
MSSFRSAVRSCSSVQAYQERHPEDAVAQGVAQEMQQVLTGARSGRPASPAANPGRRCNNSVRGRHRETQVADLP